MEDNRFAYKKIIIVLMMIAGIEVVLNLWSIVKNITINGFTVSSFFPAFMATLLYVSVITYSKKYFLDGKDASIVSMLMRFCVTVAIYAINLPDDANILMFLAVIVLILVPFMAGDLSQFKRAKLIIVVVSIAVIAMDVIRMIMFSSIIMPYVAVDVMDRIVYYGLAVNHIVQWGLFAAIYLIRSKLYLDANPECKL